MRGVVVQVLCPSRFLADAYIADATEHVFKDTAVWVVVKQVDTTEKMQAVVSMKPSELKTLLEPSTDAAAPSASDKKDKSKKAKDAADKPAKAGEFLVAVSAGWSRGEPPVP